MILAIIEEDLLTQESRIAPAVVEVDLGHAMVFLAGDVVVEVDLETLLVAGMAVAAISLEVDRHVVVGPCARLIRDSNIPKKGLALIVLIILDQGCPEGVTVTEIQIHLHDLVGIEEAIAWCELSKGKERTGNSEKGEQGADGGHDRVTLWKRCGNITNTTGNKGFDPLPIIDSRMRKSPVVTP